MPTPLPTAAGAALSEQFATLQVLLLIAIALLAARFLLRGSRDSRFRGDSPAGARPTSRQKDRKKQKHKDLRMLLGGFSFTGQPHEILGVQKDAGELEIRRAHRALIKRFHPDKVGRQGSREWHEAQKIAEAINTARDEMLRALPR